MRLKYQQLHLLNLARVDIPVSYVMPEFDLETKVVLERMQREYV